MADGFILSPEDRNKVSRLIRETGNQPKNNPVSHYDRNRKYERVPELYVASPPESTEIPARAGDVPGELECEIFRLMQDYDTGEVTITPLLDEDDVPVVQLVYNVYDRAITGWITPNRKYIQINRSKDGAWLCEAAAPDLIYFQLAEDKHLNTDPITADVLGFNGTIWSASGTQVFLHDSYYPAPGFFTGVNGYDRGWAQFRTPKDPEDVDDLDHYEILWMSGPAHVLEFTLTAARSTSSGEALTINTSTDIPYLYGRDISPTTVYFNAGYFLTAYVGAKGIALWNDRDLRYQVVYCQETGDYGIPFYNDSGGTIAAYAAMVHTGAYDANGYPKMTQAASSWPQICLVNGPTSVASTAIGLGSYMEHGRLSPYGRVLYDSGSGTPAIGEEWGPKSGQFSLVKNRPGFRIMGNPDTTNHHVLAIQNVVRGLIGKLTGSVSANGGSGTLNIWFGAGASEAVSSEGWTVSVINNTSLTLAASKWCSAVWRNGVWYVEPWAC